MSGGRGFRELLEEEDGSEKDGTTGKRRGRNIASSVLDCDWQAPPQTSTVQRASTVPVLPRLLYFRNGP